MKLVEQVPRNALAWIILAMFALLAPHVFRLPIWVLAVYLLAVTWRIMVYRGRWSFPGRWVKVAMTLSCCAGIYTSYGSLIGLEPTVALLLAAFALKLVELARRKDAYVLLFLGYFICITEFLFSQDLLITLYGFVTVALVTAALVALHQPGVHRFSFKPLKLSSVMLVQALPLMIVLFFLFPRFGPLWAVPIKGLTAKTGMSDFMKPGDVASLSQSDEVAFRVKFDGAIPRRADLYWRGLVLSEMKQGAWRTLGHFDIPAQQRRPQKVETLQEPIRYSIIMEATQQNWLYGLHYATSPDPGVVQGSDFRMFTLVPVESERMYRVRSWTQAPVELQLSNWRRKIETRLPPVGNPRTRTYAEDLRAESASDEDFVDAVLSQFTEKPFVYTLRPGLLSSSDAMDEFMFESRRGFCEHYASAFVIMMRAAGVPARVIGGYQGGEVNPTNKTVIVHQFDAHAWAEVWFEGKGWTRIDPTGAVSPDRVELGLESAMQDEGSFLADIPFSPLRYRSIPLINRLRLEYDALTYRWQSWVVGFDNRRQFELLHDLFGEVSARMFAALLLGSWALVLIPVATVLLLKRNIIPLRPLDKRYRVFCDRLASVGLVREAGEAPVDFADRAALALPQCADGVQRISALYARLSYAPDGADPQEIKAFAREVRRFRPSRAHQIAKSST